MEDKRPDELHLDDFLTELPPLNPALVQGNCSVAPMPHTETQGQVPTPIVKEDVPPA